MDVHAQSAGPYLRTQRTAARLSLRRVSEICGYSPSYIAKIERGLEHPPIGTIARIGDAIAQASYDNDNVVGETA